MCDLRENTLCQKSRGESDSDTLLCFPGDVCSPTEDTAGGEQEGSTPVMLGRDVKSRPQEWAGGLG